MSPTLLIDWASRLGGRGPGHVLNLPGQPVRGPAPGPAPVVPCLADPPGRRRLLAGFPDVVGNQALAQTRVHGFPLDAAADRFGLHYRVSP
jgi:hypothetical protein